MACACGRDKGGGGGSLPQPEKLWLRQQIEIIEMVNTLWPL
jgi:hypothetical protein